MVRNCVGFVILAALGQFPGYSQYATSVVAGGGGVAISASTNAPATQVALSRVMGVGLDSIGNIYASTGNTVVQVSPANVLSVAAGKDSNVQELLFSGPAPVDILQSPGGVATDSKGNLYVADYDDSRIRKFAPDGTITTVVGPLTTNALGGFSGDGGPAANARINGPMSVALDAAGDVYIADTWNCRIRKVDTSGNINTVAGNGQCAFSGDGGPATSAAIAMSQGVAVDAAGNLYISDYANQRIRKVDINGTISTVAGSGRQGYSGDGGPALSATMAWPTGIVVDIAGNIYFADFYNNVVRKVTPTGIITTVAGTGLSGYFGDGGPAIGAQLSYPQGVALDAAGNLFIGENARVRKVTPAGTISTVAGNPGNYYDDGTQATSVALPAANDVLLAPDGSFYVSTDNRVLKVSPNGVIGTTAGTGQSGFAGDGGPAKSSLLRSSTGLALDAAGYLYIADPWNANIRRVAPDGTINTLAGVGGPGFSGDGGLAYKAQLSNPQGLAADQAGKVYIGDTGNNRVRMVTPQGMISTFVGTGQQGFSGDGGPATQAQLTNPTGLAADAVGNLYIADVGNQRIRKVDTHGIITTVAGNGQDSFTGDGGPATAAALCFPEGLAVDAAGNIYIVDSGNNRIRMVDASTGIIQTIVNADLGGDDYQGVGGGVAVDPNGNLYIAEFLDNLVLKATKVSSTYITSVVNAATFSTTGAASPGSLISAQGFFLASAAQSATTAALPIALLDTSVAVNGSPAPLSYVSPVQVNLQIPFDTPVGMESVQISRGSGSAATAKVAVTTVSPGIFRLGGDVNVPLQGAILTSTGEVAATPPSVNGIPSRPANPGEIVSIYCTGLGDVTIRPANGAPAPAGPPYSYTLLQPTVTVGGMPATVLYSGLAPDQVGVYQINVQLPSNPPQYYALPVTVTIGGMSDTVTMSVL